MNAACAQYGGCPSVTAPLSLPFTGLDVALVLVVAVLLVVAGLALRTFITRP